MSGHPALECRVVSQAEMDAWPVDRARSGEKRWAESTWGTGPLEGPNRLLYNWNTWPCRVVFEVTQAGACVRAEAVWRRSRLSIRLRGLKLVVASTGEVVHDARLVAYDQERVVVDFRPAAGPGIYHLYFGAFESALFEPSHEWLRAASASKPADARASHIEARTAIERIDVMESIALPDEVDALRRRLGDPEFVVFAEDRDRPIRLQFELPRHWAIDGPRPALTLHADRNEYRVFQLGIWANRRDVATPIITATALVPTAGGEAISADRVQCLTLHSRIKSRYIERPSGKLPVPRGQVRSLWFGVDLPEDAKPGEYRGSVTLAPPGLVAREIPIQLVVSNTVTPDRGDHDLHRLARLRWLESDIGLSDKVYPPFKPLRVTGRTIRSWGHAVELAPTGLPASVRVGEHRVTRGPLALSGKADGKRIAWAKPSLKFITKKPGVVEWRAVAPSGAVELVTDARMEYDACVVFDLTLRPRDPEGKPVNVSELTLTLPWSRGFAGLASGVGYRGRRDGDRTWRSTQRPGKCYDPAIWMGSVDAGLYWRTWALDRFATQAGMATAANSLTSTDAWQDAARADAMTIREEGDAVVLRLNLGAHAVSHDRPWRMRFALLPTPVKPPDPRHWDFRYMHKGGGFWPGDGDTPQSFLKDDRKRLDMVANELGVKRLNLHDWWGPAFNYPWQWDGPDNLSSLTREAHRRGVRVKVYNSGRELSNFAPEFWAMVHEGAAYKFADEVDPNPRLWFQDAWRQRHLPDGLPAGWPRVHADRGNEHAIPVSNATRNGNFYLESMRYMTQHFGTDGAYWDGADGPTLGHREMAKRLFVIFKQHNRHAATDVHHGHPLTGSPIADHLLCFPFIDSLWHGEGFESIAHDPFAWLVETAALPFGVPSEMLGMDDMLGRGMLFGIWPRHGWYRETDKPAKLWKFFDRFDIRRATMRGFWSENGPGVTVDRPETLVTSFVHPRRGALLVVASWHAPLAAWMEQTLDVTLLLDRKSLRLPAGKLVATDIFSDENLDIDAPIPLPDPKFGRLLWVRGA